MQILNDYSIDNQFSTMDEFIDSLFNYTIPLLQTLEKYKIELSKSYDIYGLKVVNNRTLLDTLNARGYPEVAKFKNLLHKRLMDNPYWEKDFEEQDCINKAYQMNVGLISFEHGKYLDEYIDYLFNKESIRIFNCYNKRQLYEQLRRKSIISTGEYITNRYKEVHTFCNIENKDYFEKIIKENNIKLEDINKITRDLIDFIGKYQNNQDLGKLSKNIETNLHEFRTTISESREFRILYCIYNSKIAFLNCFIKKQQKTPETEKEQGRKLRDLVYGDEI